MTKLDDFIFQELCDGLGISIFRVMEIGEGLMEVMEQLRQKREFLPSSIIRGVRKYTTNEEELILISWLCAQAYKYSFEETPEEEAIARLHTMLEKRKQQN